MATLMPFEGSEPELHPSCWVAPTATLVGSVRLGAWANVWFGAVLRADSASIEVGAETNVQDNCVLHVDQGSPIQLGRRVSIGHSSTLHGCAIEDGALIGMGATVLNGARVHAGALVAAGSVVLEGDVVPPDSLFAGVPGKVRRLLAAEEVQQIRRNADAYLAFARRFQAEATS